MRVAMLVSLSTTGLWGTEPPSFRHTASPVGWTLTKGGTETGAVLRAKAGGTAEWRTASPRDLPSEATFRFRATVGDGVTLLALGSGEEAKPLLECAFRLPGVNQASIVARASGEPMQTDTRSTRTWSQLDKVTGSLTYAWRFPRVRNLWDERDRAEIGAAYEQLAPFTEKTFAARLVLTAKTRQIWIDDRLVAEACLATPASAHFVIQLAKNAEVLSVESRQPPGTDRFQPLPLTQYSHAKDAQDEAVIEERVELDSVPMLVPKSPRVEIDLGESLYRYRLTHSSGPDAAYVNALRTWPGAFQVDPARFTFRVPYRHYQNVWLLAWLDREANSVPRGTFRFYREDAGYPASTGFEISDEAIRKGLVTKLARKTADGKQLYLVRVPVDTNGLYGFRDLSDQFLEFELSKPVSLGRSYPDPIYYGYHAGGLPSSIHVIGITLEESPFGYEVRPSQLGHVFERPEKPAYTVAIGNTSAKPLEAKVTLRTRSFDGDETHSAETTAKIEPGTTGEANLSFDLKRNGWHELNVRVEAGDVVRENTMSLVLLSSNTRTYGNAVNETRFGIWTLWGHYLPLRNGKFEHNERVLAMLRKLGLRRVGVHRSFLNPDILKRHDFLPTGPHTDVAVFHRLDENNPEAMKKMVEAELAQVGELAKDFPDTTGYYYGGEWHLSREIQYAPWPRYTGDGDRELTEEERKRAERQAKIFTAIGKAMREKFPKTKLYLQWGAPQGTLAYLKYGIAKEIVDCFGMDAPMFELLPEISNVTGSINGLWWLRAEAEKLGWPRLPIGWCEGPFFPTNPGALSECAQMEYQVRYWLLGMAYGIDYFHAGVVEYDAGNYYGAEHYGAGVFHRTPLAHPKPAVAAIATATTMLCGADPVGAIDTGVLTTYCMAFQRAASKQMIYALWRVNGTVDANVRVAGTEAIVTDAMGNSSKLPVKDGRVTVTLSSSPVWLTGIEKIEGFEFGEPKYDSALAQIRLPLVRMTAANWTYDGSEDKAYANNHFAIRRMSDPNLKAEFGCGEAVHSDAVAITLPVESGDRPLANRYGALRAKKPIKIPGKATALGIWVKGNSSWGRIVYQLRDARGEIWTSNGTKDDWNCDDTHGWSYVSFEGWRYARFPLPGNQPWDAARELETTWWGSRDGDGIVDLPLAIEKIYVETRNEVPYLSEMKLVRERGYKLSGLVAEYDSEADTRSSVIARHNLRKPLPAWRGPTDNPIAKLRAEGIGEAPPIQSFIEPPHWNDGRRMIIRFEPKEGFKHNLYLSRYADGRGAELLKPDVKHDQLVTGMRPETKMYFFLTAVGPDKKESKPSAPYELVTHDHFAEK